MTPEEKYHSDKWFVLQQIKEKELYTPKSKQSLHIGFGNHRVWPSGIQYRLNITPNSIHEKCPPSKQINILRQLAEEGSIKIIHEENESGYGAYYLFILEVIRPKFDELYEEYRKRFDTQYALKKLPEDIAKSVISELFKDGVKTVTITDTVTPDKRKAQLEALKRVIEKSEEREKIKREIIEEIKSEGVETQPQSVRPYCVVEGGKGYFKFYKEGEKILVGGKNSRHFRLLQCLCEPHFGVQKTVDAVFEAIRKPEDKKDSRLADFNPQKKTRMLELIDFAKKELQKNKKLQGRLKYNFDAQKNNMWLSVEG